MTSLLAWYRRGPGLRGDDSGFSLIEAVVALMIATVAFTALAAGAMSAIRASLTSRQSQQAADLMAQRIEELRLVDFGGLAISDTAPDLASDPAITPCSGGPWQCVDVGTGTEERLYTKAGGAITDHLTTVQSDTTNRTSFTVATYVTAPNWAQREYFRRLTVVVTWQDGEIVRSRSDSSVVTYTQRGLPLPVFKLTPVGPTTQAVNPGATVVFGLAVTNQGAPDRFSLSEDDAYTWDWFFDDGDGVYNSATDTTAVTDTDGNGVIDTGKIDPNGVVRVWLVRTIPSTASEETINTVVSGTSVSQPLADGGVQTAPFQTQVVFGTVTATPTTTATATSPVTDCAPASTAVGSADSGYTSRSYTLHNAATPGDTTAQQTLTMAVTAPYATTLYEYSTDVQLAQPGRILLPGGVAFPAGSTDPIRVADWRFPVGAKAYSGTAAVNLWVAPPVGGALSSVSLKAYVYKYTKVGSSYAATQLVEIPLSVPVFTCTGLQQVGGTAAVSVPTNGSGSLGPNDWMGLRVVNAGTSPVRIAYDVQSLYAASLALPEK